MMTLEGGSLFDMDITFQATRNKFDSSYHGQLKDVVAVCRLDGFGDQMDRDEASEVINLSRKNSQMNRMPSSIIARMDPNEIPRESYEGITYDAEEFQFATFGEKIDEVPCRIIGSDSSTGVLDVLVFFAQNGKRQLLRYQSFDADRLEFRVPSNKEDGLSSLLAVLRNHFLKELDDDGLTTESFLRFKTALSSADSIQDVSTVLHRNGTAMATLQRRSKEWLEENGKLHIICTCIFERGGNRFWP